MEDKFLDWRNAFLAFLTVGFLLVFYFQVRLVNQIQTKQFEINKNIKASTPAEVFNREFDERGIAFDRNIHNSITKLRETTKAGWAVLWGFHDGKTVGPLHLKRTSVIDESSVHDESRFFPVFQNWNINLFADYYIQYWETRQPQSDYIHNIENNNVQAHLSKQGAYFKTAVGIYIEEYDHPIALLSLYFTQEEAKQFQRDPSRLIQVNNEIKRVSDSISTAFTERYANLQSEK